MSAALLFAFACNLELQPYVAPDNGGSSGSGSGPGDSGKNNAGPPEGGAGGADATTALDASTPSDAGGVKRVFVSSTVQNGAFGGVAAAHAKCQQLATDAKLGGTWIAWISVTGDEAAQRLQGNGPWYLVDRTTRVFASKAAISTTGPEVTIERDEKGAVVPQSPGVVWTGTDAIGRAANQNCGGWAVNFSNGLVGFHDERNDSQWTQAQSLPCTQNARFYCFEL